MNNVLEAKPLTKEEIYYLDTLLIRFEWELLEHGPAECAYPAIAEVCCIRGRQLYERYKEYEQKRDAQQNA